MFLWSSCSKSSTQIISGWMGSIQHLAYLAHLLMWFFIMCFIITISVCICCFLLFSFGCQGNVESVDPLLYFVWSPDLRHRDAPVQTILYHRDAPVHWIVFQSVRHRSPQRMWLRFTQLAFSFSLRTPRSCRHSRPSGRRRRTWRAASSASAAAPTWSTSTSCSWWQRAPTQPG